MFKIILIALGCTCFLTSCATDTSNLTTSDADSSKPVETKAPNSTYQPAFPGQTRVAGVKTKTPYQGTAINKSLKRPWGITALPDGKLLITEKEGTMRIATTTGQVSEPITGLPAVNAGGQGGLLGLTLDPKFNKNRMVYWVFSEKTANGNLTSVAKGSLSKDERRIENAVVIYRATPAYNGTLHYGGRIIFDASGYLIVGTGERSDMVTRPQAQQLNSANGKIVRITVDGKAPISNPFVRTEGAKPEIYSYGHRNVQGLAFHPETGELWANEFGPRAGDELNLIKPGKNYGWPVISYGLEYSGKKVGAGITQQAGMEQPVYYWDPVLSPSGMIFYTDKYMSEWKNNLFICGLNSNHIARLVIRNNKVVGEEKILAGEGQRFRDITQGKDGAMYAVTDEGRLYRIAKK